MLSGPARLPLKSPLLALALVASALLGGCAGAPPERVTQTQDPWEGFNRKVYAFNDALDKNVARPVARTYVRAVPGPARSGVHNVVSNLVEPVTVVNDALQGKLKQTLQDLGRFVINSTVGILGWFDVAKHVGLPHHDEDFGQTLATWGVSSGPYLVLPVIGPSTVRDAGGRVADIYTDPPRHDLKPRWRNAELVVYGIDTRAGLMETNETLDNSYDPYAFMRDAYLQNRRFKIYDGEPPPDDSMYDLPDDEPGEAPAGESPAPGAGTAAAPSATTAPAATSAPAPATAPPPPR
ncbi:MAG TPA: VacJ family lipoprotein [Gammaproteobacteria bacterium]